MLQVNRRSRARGPGLQLSLSRSTSGAKRVQDRVRMGIRSRSMAIGAALTLGLALGGCFTQTYQRGYVLAIGALEHTPRSAPQEQVLISLGTPSTVATVRGHDI